MPVALGQPESGSSQVVHLLDSAGTGTFFSRIIVSWAGFLKPKIVRYRYRYTLFPLKRRGNREERIFFLLQTQERLNNSFVSDFDNFWICCTTNLYKWFVFWGLFHTQPVLPTIANNRQIRNSKIRCQIFVFWKNKFLSGCKIFFTPDLPFFWIFKKSFL